MSYPAVTIVLVARFEVPEGWTAQAFAFALDCTPEHAAVNLARYEDTGPAGDSAVGPVGAAVKRRADRKTGPRPAGGDEARKGPRRPAAGKQPRDGVPA